MVAKTVELPNVRELFLPDPGYTIFDIDLDRADAQVVGWEANDDELKTAFRAGEDIHRLNAETIFGRSNDELRQQAKKGVHATNYGATAKTVATSLGISIRDAERFQDIWFSAHPGIPQWHDRIEHSIQTTRQVHNAFGFRRFYFDRIDGLLPEALAWIPQSTVARVINGGFVNLHNNMPDVQVLLQVHDSLVAQCPTRLFVSLLEDIRKNVLITVPYEDPLIIGVGIKASTKSWGDCKEISWETGLPIPKKRK